MIESKHTGSDFKAFIGSKDFELSRDFYIALGFTLNFEQESIAEFELGGSKFYLQRYYQRQWCRNTMLHITVNDANAWYEHVSEVLKRRRFGTAKANPPKIEDYGARVTHVWDPSGVLLHLAEPL
jgi:hypothetical protein